MKFGSLVLTYYDCTLDRQTNGETHVIMACCSVSASRTKTESVLKLLSYLGRAANLTSAPGGQRSRYIRHCMSHRNDMLLSIGLSRAKCVCYDDDVLSMCRLCVELAIDVVDCSMH